MSEIYSFKYKALRILSDIISHFAHVAVWLLSVPLGVIRTGLQFEEKCPIMIYVQFIFIIHRSVHR